jgi:RNA polymerase sigma factor (sigma-70 family)
MFDSILNSNNLHEGLRSGLDEAYVILWREGFKFLIPCYKALGFVDEAEDLWSDTFIKLRERRYSTYNPQKSPFECWLKIVARSVAYDLMRKRERGREIIEARLNLQCAEIGPDEKGSGSLELRKLVRRAEASLRPNDRIILSLRVIEGLSFELIAEKLGISESAAAMRAFRALERLWIEMERLSPRELPRRIKRPRCRHPAGTISTSHQEQGHIASIR